MTTQDQTTQSNTNPAKTGAKHAAAKKPHSATRVQKGPTAMAEALTKASQDAGKPIVARQPKAEAKAQQKPHTKRPQQGAQSPVSKRVPRKPSLRASIKKRLEELFAEAARANLKVILNQKDGRYEVVDVQDRRFEAQPK